MLRKYWAKTKTIITNELSCFNTNVFLASEIQNIEIGSGDVCHGIAIPIYMTFPRLFACPTLESTNFKVEFELNIVVVFHDDRLIMETFPIKLTRF